MADFNQPVQPLGASTENVNFLSHPNWGAIWAGMFVFFAIWAVFGTLGVGVFASSANARASQPVLGMSVGIGAWFDILTIIAFFFAGRVTGRLARINRAASGAVYGLVMFGVTVSAAVVLIAIGGTALGILTVQGGVHSAYELSAFSYLGWTTFVGLFLGWLAAMGGASVAHKELPRLRTAAQPQVRHA
jgi:hypothetical protein